MKTVKFHTLGCKVNQYETQSIREQFLRAGFKELNNGLPVDIYVINTCTVTGRADTESLQLIRRAKRENPKTKIIVTGCLAELDSDRIRQVFPGSIIVQNKDKNRIIGLAGILDFPLQAPSSKLQTPNPQFITNFAGRTRAFLKIQDGCDNFCSYCKVPLVRGRSRSRPLNEIIAEARRLVENGFKEIVLTGICLGSYGSSYKCRGGLNLPYATLIDVISALENIDGLLRIRLSSIEAGDVSDALIDKMANSKKLCRHLHIPLQSGDNDILRKMNRKYCREDFLKRIKKIKNAVPGIPITTDVIVGFPGEEEKNFRNTAGLIEKICPLKVHIFPYSKREGTAAFNFKDEVKSGAVKDRLTRLKEIADSCALSYKKQFLIKNMDVLIEGRDKNGLWEGYTDNYMKVLLKSDKNLQNQVISCKLKNYISDFIRADFS